MCCAILKQMIIPPNGLRWARNLVEELRVLWTSALSAPITGLSMRITGGADGAHTNREP